MESRARLQEILEEILGSDDVYFQPPPTVRLSYPCIVYNKASIFTQHADDIKYRNLNRYTVTPISSDPDSDLPDKIHEGFRYCSPDRFFTIDNLNHWTFTLYF
jgi:hypothetical protein